MNIVHDTTPHNESTAPHESINGKRRVVHWQIDAEDGNNYGSQGERPSEDLQGALAGADTSVGHDVMEHEETDCMAVTTNLKSNRKKLMKQRHKRNKNNKQS